MAYRNDYDTEHRFDRGERDRGFDRDRGYDYDRERREMWSSGRDWPERGSSGFGSQGYSPRNEREFWTNRGDFGREGVNRGYEGGFRGEENRGFEAGYRGEGRGAYGYEGRGFEGRGGYGYEGRGYESGRGYEGGRYGRGWEGYGQGAGYYGQSGYGQAGREFNRGDWTTTTGYGGRSEGWNYQNPGREGRESSFSPYYQGGQTGGAWGGGLGASFGGSVQPSWGGEIGGYAVGQHHRGSHTGRGPKNYTRSDDRIREDINERLTQHPHIDATEIDIEVRNGEVTIKGTVDDRHAKRMAEDITEGVSGVKQVHNQLRVQEHAMTAGGSRSESSTSGTTSAASAGTRNK